MKTAMVSLTGRPVPRGAGFGQSTMAVKPSSFGSAATFGSFVMRRSRGGM